MPWCFIESSQNGTLPDAVPGPRVFEHEVPCPKVVGAKSTKRQKTRRVLDNIMTVIKERLKSISSEEKDEDNLENTKELKNRSFPGFQNREIGPILFTRIST
jgi:hypothetical protein